MESLLQGIPKVRVYVDNTLVTGRTEEHLANLTEGCKGQLPQECN